MADFNINNDQLNNRFRKAALTFAPAKSNFNRRNLAITGNAIGIKVLQGKLFNIPDAEYEDTSNLPKSYLNTPILNEVKLGFLENPENQQDIQPNVYIDLDGNEIPYEPVSLQSVITLVTQNKNIITTPIQGVDGTVKEYISLSDYQITLQGYISTKDFVYPEEEVEKLVKLCNIPAAIPVISEHLQLFGIDDIVIKDYDISERAGFRNSQIFTINALSDNDINLTDVTT